MKANPVTINHRVRFYLYPFVLINHIYTLIDFICLHNSKLLPTFASSNRKTEYNYAKHWR